MKRCDDGWSFWRADRRSASARSAGVRRATSRSSYVMDDQRPVNVGLSTSAVTDIQPSMDGTTASEAFRTMQHHGIYCTTATPRH